MKTYGVLKVFTEVMVKDLQIFKKLLSKRLMSMSRWIVLIGVVFSLQDGFGYTPGSIRGKYQFIEVGSGFYYDYWMPTMKSNWGSEKNVRESLVPSCIVDWYGDLYTAHVSGFDSSGIKICLKKNVNGVTKLTKEFYPWTYLPNTTVKGKVTAKPNLSILECDSGYFKNCAHNIFMPTLVQETDKYSTYVRLFLPIPPTRFMNANCSDSKGEHSSIEGMLSMRWPKSDFAKFSREFYYHTENRTLSFGYMTCRAISGHKYPVLGNIYGACLWYGTTPSDMWVYHFSGESGGKDLHYIKTTTKLVKRGDGLVASGTGSASDDIRIANRFIKHDGYIYFLTWGWGYWLNLVMQNLDGQHIKAVFAPGIYTESQGGVEPSHYDYDFSIVKNPNTGKLVLAILSFGGNNGESWATLKSAYNWVKDYCSWEPEKISLVLRSYPLSAGTTSCDIQTDVWRTPPENAIYTTELNFASGEACDMADTSKSDLYRLYLNTHRVCTDITNPDSRYIFYCYCYPGKIKQLYFGYAPYSFDSNDRIVLGSKREFRASSEQWSDSFEGFTSCSRIVSMDCKNGHLWITWMNGDNTKYHAFHILVKDLVGE